MSLAGEPEDIGLGDWLFDHDSAEDQARIAPAVLEMVTNLDVSQAKAQAARELVEQRQRETMTSLRQAID